LALAVLVGILAHGANKRDIERQRRREEQARGEAGLGPGTQVDAEGASGDAVVDVGSEVARRGSRAAQAQERYEERYPLVDLRAVDLSYEWHSDGKRDPEIDIPVRAHSEPVDHYLVNLAKRSCTCQRFYQGRVSLAADQQGRLCRHLLAELSTNGRFEARGLGLVLLEHAQLVGWMGGWVRAWFFDASNGRIKGHPCFVVQEFPGEPEWVSVLVVDPNRAGVGLTGVLRYGWSLREERWARGEAPPQAMELKPLLRGLARSLGVEAAPRNRR
jgi:hypothetical protein